MGQLQTTFGTWFFIRTSGRPQTLGMNVEDITRPGVSGTALRQEAAHGKPFEVTTIADFDTAVDAAQNAALMTRAKGLIVTLVDDVGNTYPNLALLDAECVHIQNLVPGSAVGGLSALKGALLTMRLRLQATK